MLAFNQLLLSNQLISTVWKWEGHMSNLVTISNSDNIVNKQACLYTFSCVSRWVLSLSSGFSFPDDKTGLMPPPWEWRCIKLLEDVTTIFSLHLWVQCPFFLLNNLKNYLIRTLEPPTISFVFSLVGLCLLSHGYIVSRTIIKYTSVTLVRESVKQVFLIYVEFLSVHPQTDSIFLSFPHSYDLCSMIAHVRSH